MFPNPRRREKAPDVRNMRVKGTWHDNIPTGTLASHRDRGRLWRYRKGDRGQRSRRADRLNRPGLHRGPSWALGRPAPQAPGASDGHDRRASVPSPVVHHRSRPFRCDHSPVLPTEAVTALLVNVDVNDEVAGRAVGVQWELRPVLALGDQRFAFALPLDPGPLRSEPSTPGSRVSKLLGTGLGGGRRCGSNAVSRRPARCGPEGSRAEPLLRGAFRKKVDYSNLNRRPEGGATLVPTRRTPPILKHAVQFLRRSPKGESLEEDRVLSGSCLSAARNGLCCR